MSRIGYDRNDNWRRRRQPKPRPEGHSGNSGNSYPRHGGHSSGNSAGRPAPQPRKARGPAGPSRIEPSQPRSAKHRRRMAKAAAWRLAKLLHVRPADILSSADLHALVIRAYPNGGPCSGRGPAARLAAKVRRLATAKA